MPLKSGLSKPALSCHKYNLKPILTDYIYPNSYFLQNCKKGKPRKKDLPLIKELDNIDQHRSRYQRFGIDDFDPKCNHIKEI